MTQARVQEPGTPGVLRVRKKEGCFRHFRAQLLSSDPAGPPTQSSPPPFRPCFWPHLSTVAWKCVTYRSLAAQPRLPNIEKKGPSAKSTLSRKKTHDVHCHVGIVGSVPTPPHIGPSRWPREGRPPPPFHGPGLREVK